ncbi:MAG: hypothetical protein ABIJ09_15750 [Pseudomonadota bacterium]
MKTVVLLLGVYGGLIFGACVLPENLGDDAGLVPAEEACAVLLSTTCGPAMQCEHELSCEAARYLVQQDRSGERCQQALQDVSRYPVCRDLGGVVLDGDSCAELVQVVCGSPDPATGTRTCHATPACINANLLVGALVTLADAGMSDVQTGAQEFERQERCVSALNEKALYPPCRP